LPSSILKINQFYIYHMAPEVGKNLFLGAIRNDSPGSKDFLFCYGDRRVEHAKAYGSPTKRSS
jgi:hypothetical protein